MSTDTKNKMKVTLNEYETKLTVSSRVKSNIIIAKQSFERKLSGSFDFRIENNEITVYFLFFLVRVILVGNVISTIKIKRHTINCLVRF